jgi:hypothetical protein
LWCMEYEQHQGQHFLLEIYFEILNFTSNDSGWFFLHVRQESFLHQSFFISVCIHSLPFSLVEFFIFAMQFKTQLC